MESSLAVFRVNGTVAEFSRGKSVEYLLLKAATSVNGTARICFHQSDKDLLQLMLIALGPGRTFPFHLHNKKSEFLVHVAGSGVVEVSEERMSKTVVFDERTMESGVVFIPKSTWHSVSAGPQGLALFEFTQGPFRSSDTVFRAV